MRITLSKPPSVNHLYGLTARGGVARSYITKEGIAWFEESAGILAKDFKRKAITDPVEIWVELYHTRKQDVDNVLKALLDLLSKWCVNCQTKTNRKKKCICGKNQKISEDDDQVYR